MKTFAIFRTGTALLLLALLLAAASSSVYAQALNIIEGRITDENNRPVYNAYVELYSNTGALAGRDRSSSQGRFSFRQIPTGRYTILVKPLGTNLEEESQVVELYNLTSYAPDVQFVEFQLRIDKRLLQQKPQLTGTIYAQEVPNEAKRKFESGREKLMTGNETGLTDLGEAIKIFPTYFDALSALGKEHVARGKYSDGYPLLLRAIDVHKRCGDCYYSLGVAFYRLGELPAALKAVDAAVELEPGSGDVKLLHGIVLRLSEKDGQAEASLLKAESLYGKKPNAEVHRQLALLYNRMKKNEQAADRMELYLRDSPNLDKKEKESVRELIAKLRRSKDQ